MTQSTNTRTILATAILLMLGVMACPNTPWDSGDPTRELERMHAQGTPEPASAPATDESLNLLIRLADGNPAPGVAIRISDPARGSKRNRVLYEGVTDEDGRCVATLRLPASVPAFAVEWSAPKAANASDPVAPRSWKHVARTLVDRRELATLELSLARP